MPHLQVGRAFYPLVLLAIGVGWGLTQPLGKIAASSGHRPFGLIFWQLMICCLVLGALCLILRQRPLFTRRAIEFYLVVAICGTLIPNYTFYTSIARLPSGIMSVVAAAIPLLAVPMALAIGAERFSPLRMLGICLGLLGVALIALPGGALPEAAMIAFLPVAFIGPIFYAAEGVYVAQKGMAGMGAVPAMLGSSMTGVIFSLPLSWLTGEFFWPALPLGREETALVASASLHALLYASYIWLAARAGAVFAGQSSYIITVAGVLWAMVLLGEKPSPMIWLSSALLLGGVFLVRPLEKASKIA